ncbi:hypothetical protein RT99_20395 [Flavobacterium sp. MEB061]|uniref:hypothetical protein n=1 Tax=Flavobacterium sp. MEB061 TaxID=1587524 RepID=UPI0005ACEC46|nr:hypothetical protein [Flavobacterium sp. MEB061]KIQ16434.1 hypothetical protein RT99_20395 [Flavobacterium sp. MEB061]
MGTSIHCIIPKEKEYSLEETEQRLNDVFKRLKAEFLHLKEFGHFTKNERGNWFITPNQIDGFEYATGESDSFSINIYKKVVLIGCIERFSSLYFQERNMSEQLFKIITEIAKEFCDSGKLLIGAEGMGETDHIINMACENADFDQICNKTIELNGIPAKELNDLYDKSWYLK